MASTMACGKRILSRLLPFLFMAALWVLLSRHFGSQLVPTPLATAKALWSLLCEGATWRHLSLTLFRGTAGLGLALLTAFILGIPCGLNRFALAALAPLVTVVQSCPPIIWISLLLVWANSGSTAPIVVVFAATVPVLFLNVAHGVAALDNQLLVMARVYRIPRARVIRQIMLPGISRYALSAFSFALGITWKVTATAEFFGSGEGVGSRIYWANRNMDMEGLFAWTALIIAVGLILEVGLIHPLRDADPNHADAAIGGGRA